MQYRKLGDTGMDVSELCFGTWRFSKEASDGTIETERRPLMSCLLMVL
jgi:aryl-alcohol dehydrogenase-like predicted oxidoreductase